MSNLNRKVFERELLAELRARLKGTKWKKSGSAFFRQAGSFYQDAYISVHRDAARTEVTLGMKPVALDPILWDILDMPDNLHQSLSFRSWAVYQCTALPIHEEELEQPGYTASDVADKLASICKNENFLPENVLSNTTFSDLVAADANQMARGAYAITLVASLINDGNFELTRRTCHAYDSGELKSCIAITVAGKSFFKLALEWIDAGKYSSDALRSATGRGNV